MTLISHPVEGGGWCVNYMIMKLTMCPLQKAALIAFFVIMSSLKSKSLISPVQRAV